MMILDSGLVLWVTLYVCNCKPNSLNQKIDSCGADINGYFIITR